MSERSIIEKLFGSRRLSEAGFKSGGSTYRYAFGRYYKDDEQVSRDEYFKAKETSTDSTSTEYKSRKNTYDIDVESYASKAGSKMSIDKNGPYFYDKGSKKDFDSAVESMRKDFSSAYPESDEYQITKSQKCYYDRESGIALVVKESEVPGKSWVQVKHLSESEVDKIMKSKEEKPKANDVSDDDYQKIKDKLTNERGKIEYRKAEDDDLVVLSNRGDNRAQEEIISRYEKLVRNVAKDLFIQGGDKEDLVQEGLIGLVMSMKDYKPGKNKNFKNFAILAAKRSMLDAIRSANTWKNDPLNKADDYEVAGTPELPSSSLDKNNPETAYIEKSEEERLSDYMKDNLTPWERKVLSYYLQGYSYDEIADTTGKDNKSINNAMNKVRSKLRKYKELYKESALVESILESIESNNLESMKESYKILFN